MKMVWVSILLTLVVVSGCTQAARQAEVAAKGADVMPFDLERTTHIFEKIENGGQQQVIADQPVDAEQVSLIRQHLAEEAERFAKGDFHDPSTIHGEQMPGLHELVLGADRITIAYSEIADGGQILYTTDDFALVEAIHLWFDAQLSDHGSHSTGNR